MMRHREAPKHATPPTRPARTGGTSSRCGSKQVAGGRGPVGPAPGGACGAAGPSRGKPSWRKPVVSGVFLRGRSKSGGGLAHSPPADDDDSADGPVYAPTRESLAWIFDVGVRSIGRYLAQGAPAKVEGQGYDVGAWWRWLKDRPPGGVPKDATEEEAVRQKIVAQAELATIKVEQARGRLIPRAEAERKLDTMLEFFEKLIDNASRHLSAELTKARSPEQIRRVVDDYWRNVRKALAERIRGRS